MSDSQNEDEQVGHNPQKTEPHDQRADHEEKNKVDSDSQSNNSEPEAKGKEED